MESQKKQVVSIHLTEAAREALRAKSKDAGVSMSVYVESLLMEVKNEDEHR